LNFIPNIGFIFSFIPPALIALLNLGVGKAIGVFVGFFLINAFMENVIRPIFFKKALNISVLLTFVSMLFWGFILGLTGTILAIPLTLLIMRVIKDQGNKTNEKEIPDPLVPAPERASRKKAK
jgi:predicted PurR-regulated permease PerM